MHKNAGAKSSAAITHSTPIAAADFAQDLDLTHEELLRLLNLAAEVKRAPGNFRRALEGKSAALLFEKPSLRTRLTFELAVQQMGGSVVSVEGPIGAREPVCDVARNLDRWVNVIVARTFDQRTIEELGQWSLVPVVNALSDRFHPCQVLADMLTFREHFGAFRHRKLAFVGDGNNVAHSLMLNSARLGIDFAIATPPGFEPDAHILAEAQHLAVISGSDFLVTSDPAHAVRGAHAVYTDVWTSMGQETENASRIRHFRAYQVNDALLANAPGALFMHCLPAKRGEEVTDEVMESPRSIAWDQAENRLHTSKALLQMLLAA